MEVGNYYKKNHFKQKDINQELRQTRMNFQMIENLLE